MELANAVTEQRNYILNMEYAWGKKVKELTFLNLSLNNEVRELKTKINNITSVIRQIEKDNQGCTGGCATSGTHHLDLAARPVINKAIQRTLFNSGKLIDVVEKARATQLKPGSQPVGDSRTSTDNSGDKRRIKSKMADYLTEIT